ncbi:PQQ-binding-like beta-propeller repeat protein [Cellulomonas pakistanensis]|uniref:PQQ-binding-like beta-propeller repeat protein n=1 Tax=Cellulomonas pakistanensis TaxID=992287 RepID=A0A919P767_9CELL|nr:PQQ-binding-like beta-propeller repeat protein [Cellulomonas pakistanensis]GIG35609.1 hypothetical protein Cpa01nite_09900 [Cellulomonas pakistanensis]
MGAGRMTEVQLDDAAGPAAPARAAEPERARRARARALLRRWWPVPAALAAAGVAVVAWQLAADARAEDVAERLRATPGVIGSTVDADLDVVPVESVELSAVLSNGYRTETGFVAGLLLEGPGPAASVVGVDPQRGVEQWRVEVAPEARGLTTRDGSCGTAVDGPARTLWCVVTDSRALDGTPAATRLVEVDVVDGTIRGERALTPGATAAAVEDVLAVATSGDAGVRVVGQDARTGEERWTAQVPGRAALAYGTGWLRREGGHLLVTAESATWAVDPGTGEVRAGGAGVAVVRGGRLVDVQGSSRTLLLGEDGTGSGVADGQPALAGPDDGSAPDVLVVDVADGSLVGLTRGVDATSGEPLWERPSDGMSRTNRLLLDGVLYGSSSTSLWAVDVRTGDELWTAEGDPLDGFRLMTDGRQLLRVERDPASGDPRLAAYDLGSGRPAWRTPLPDGVESVWTSSGTLYGQDDDAVVLLR